MSGNCASHAAPRSASRSTVVCLNAPGSSITKAPYAVETRATRSVCCAQRRLGKFQHLGQPSVARFEIVTLRRDQLDRHVVRAGLVVLFETPPDRGVIA